MLTLIHYPLCPFSRSIRLALNECGVQAELSIEQPGAWRPEFLRINPAGHLPVLMLRDGPVLCGAYVISEYLGEADNSFSQKSPPFELLPGGAVQRAEIRRVVDWFHRKFAEEVSSYLLEQKIYSRLSQSAAVQSAAAQSALAHNTPAHNTLAQTALERPPAPDMAALRAGYENLRHHLRYLSHLLSKQRWLAGERLSFADFAAAGHISCLDYLGDIPWSEFEDVKSWYVRLKSRPAFRPLLQDRIAGFTPPSYYDDLDF